MPATDALQNEPASRTDAEQLLLQRARAGDESAANRLIAGVSAFIKRIAKKYARKVVGVDVDDLYQAGLIAASQSITTYDPERGTVAWTSYAMTASARGVAREARKAKQLLSRFPTPDQGTEVDCESLPDADMSWDPTADGPVWSMQDALSELDPLDRAVMELAHGLTGARPLEGNEIAAELGLRRGKIVQIVSRATVRLRQILEERGFASDIHGKA